MGHLPGATAAAIRRRLVSSDSATRKAGLARARKLKRPARTVLLRPWAEWEADPEQLPVTPEVLTLLLATDSWSGQVDLERPLGIVDLKRFKFGDTYRLSIEDSAEFVSLEGSEKAGLSTVVLKALPALRSLSPLQTQHLDWVQLEGLPLVTTLRPLKSDRLRVLHLLDLPKVASLQTIRPALLTRLTVADMPKVKSLPLNPKAPLKKLILRNLPKLESIESLRGLPIEELTLEGLPALGDLSPLLDCPIHKLTARGPIGGDVRTLCQIPSLYEGTLFGLGLQWSDVPPEKRWLEVFPYIPRGRYCLADLNPRIRKPVQVEGYSADQVLVVAERDPLFTEVVDGGREWIIEDGPADVAYWGRRSWEVAVGRITHGDHDYVAVGPAPEGYWAYASTVEGVRALAGDPAPDRAGSR